MNPAQLAETLKTVPDQHLMQAVQGNIPSTPGYLALAEMKRRESLRSGAAMQQAPMTTVAQDQQMGIQGLRPQGMKHGGLVKGYAAGGLTPYGGENILQGPSPYEGMGILEFLKAVGSQAMDKSKAADAWLRRHLEPTPQQLEQERMRRSMLPYVPREPQGPMKQYPSIPAQAPAVQARPAQADVRRSEPMVPPTSASVRVGMSQSGTGIAGVKPPPAAVPVTNLPEYESIRSQDPAEILSKVPTSKILEELAKSAQIDPKQFDKRSGEAREQALARMGAAMASRPGGFGAAFGPALTGGLDYRDAQEKEIRADRKDAEQVLRQIKMAQAQEEMNRFGIARDMSKQDYMEREADSSRKYGRAKDKTDIDYRERKLASDAQLEREKMANALKVAGIYAARVSSGGAGGLSDDELKAWTTLERNALMQAESDIKQPMRMLQLAKKYNTKDPEMIKRHLANEYMLDSIKRHPFLQKYADKIPSATVAPAGTGGVPRRVETPGNITRD